MLSLKIQNQHFPTQSKIDKEFKRVGHHLSIKNTARNFVRDVWLVFGSMQKLH